MATCRTCGKNYSGWTTPVSAHGICTECFQRELEEEARTGVRPKRPPANRHGCLTAWLILMILGNGASAISTAVMREVIKQAAPGASSASIALIILAGAANIVFAIALFYWKKWGFFGFLASSIATFAINVSIGFGILPSLLGLAGIGVLYWVLQMGDAKTRAWPRLE